MIIKFDGIEIVGAVMFAGTAPATAKRGITEVCTDQLLDPLGLGAGIHTASGLVPARSLVMLLAAAGAAQQRTCSASRQEAQSEGERREAVRTVTSAPAKMSLRWTGADELG